MCASLAIVPFNAARSQNIVDLSGHNTWFLVCDMQCVPGSWAGRLRGLTWLAPWVYSCVLISRCHVLCVALPTAVIRAASRACGLVICPVVIGMIFRRQGQAL